MRYLQLLSDLLCNGSALLSQMHLDFLGLVSELSGLQVMVQHHRRLGFLAAAVLLHRFLHEIHLIVLRFYISFLYDELLLLGLLICDLLLVENNCLRLTTVHHH